MECAFDLLPSGSVARSRLDYLINLTSRPGFTTIRSQAGTNQLPSVFGPRFVHLNHVYTKFIRPKTDGSNDDGRPGALIYKRAIGLPGSGSLARSARCIRLHCSDRAVAYAERARDLCDTPPALATAMWEMGR